MDDDEKGIDEKSNQLSIESKIHLLYEHLRLYRKQIESLKRQRDHYKKGMDLYKGKYLKQQRIIKQMKDIIVCRNDGDVKMKSCAGNIIAFDQNPFIDSQPSKFRKCMNSNNNFSGSSISNIMPNHDLNDSKDVGVRPDKFFALLLESDADKFDDIQTKNNVKIKVKTKNKSNYTFVRYVRCTVKGKLPQIIKAVQQIFDKTPSKLLRVFILKNKHEKNYVQREITSMQAHTNAEIIISRSQITTSDTIVDIHGDRKDVHAAIDGIIRRFSNEIDVQSKDEQYANRIRKRLQYINKIYQTTEYQQYISALPKHLRESHHPKTPDHTKLKECPSNKQWKEKVRWWHTKLLGFESKVVNNDDNKYALLCFKGNEDPKELTESNISRFVGGSFAQIIKRECMGDMDNAYEISFYIQFETAKSANDSVNKLLIHTIHPFGTFKMSIQMIDRKSFLFWQT